MNTYCESCLDAMRQTAGPQMDDSTPAMIDEFMSIYSTELVDHDCESVEYLDDTKPAWPIPTLIIVMCHCKNHDRKSYLQAMLLNNRTIYESLGFGPPGK